MSTTNHFVPFLQEAHGNHKIVVFNDGELYVRLEETVEQQPVTVIAATQAPAQHWIELFLLLDTLTQQQAQINLLCTYCGYMRQDHPKPHVARGARVMAQCLQQFSIKQVAIIHPHSQELGHWLPHRACIPYELYVPIVKQNAIEVILAPDRGALSVCQELARLTNCAVAEIQKARPMLDEISMSTLYGDVKHKNVLIFDDIISTGSTVAGAAQLATKQGARELYVLATHSLATEDTLQKLASSFIKHIWITNSIMPAHRSDQISIINLAPFIQTVIAPH